LKDLREPKLVMKLIKKRETHPPNLQLLGAGLERDINHW